MQKVPLDCILCNLVGCELVLRSGLDRGIGSGWKRFFPIAMPRSMWADTDYSGYAEGCGTADVTGRRVQALRVALAARLHEAGVDELLRDKSRKPGKAPVPDLVVTRLIARTLSDPTTRPRTGPVGRWPALWVWRSARCRRSGPPMAWRRTG
jgi:hypothetical protein